MVARTYHGSTRSEPRGARIARGKAKVGAARSTEVDEPAPPVCGCVAGLALNGMQGVAVNGVAPGQLVVSAVVATPGAPEALELHAYGVRPAKTPTPPRSWSLPVGLQLKPRRGESTTSSLGVESVWRPRA